MPKAATAVAASASSDSSSNVPTRDSDRIARLVAKGEIPLPEGLAEDQLNDLVRRVRELRRQRLLHVIARAVASDLERHGPGKPGVQ